MGDILSGDVYILCIDVCSDDKLLCLYSISLFLLPVLYVQQCSQLTGAMQRVLTED